MLSPHDRQNLTAILTQPQRFDHWDAVLLRLIARADAANRALLAEVYPDYVDAVTEWRETQRRPVPAGA